MRSIALTLSALAASAWAQPRGSMMTRPPAFQALDADHDGVISAAEMKNAPAALKALDKNGDGKLTQDEVMPRFGEGRGRGGRRERGPGGEPGEATAPSADEMVQTFMAFDKNGDGKLTKDEVPERMQGIFDRADADHDGVLTADEIRKATPAAVGAGQGRREGRGGRGERPNFIRMDPILAAIDADSDGEISAAELAAAPVAVIKLDKNGDGQLTEDEVRMNFGFGRGRGRQ